MPSRYVCTAVVATAAGIVAPASANLVVNGSFEDSPLNPGATWIAMGGGDSSITGWVTVGAGIDYMGGILQASDGDRSIDLNNVTSGGGIAQTFATNAGWIYTVEFDLSANMYGGPSPKIMSVDAAGQSAEFEFDYIAAGSTAADPAWERISWTFVASGPQSTLTFMGISGGVFGADIDNVVVTGAVPTPGAIGLGLAGMTLAARRRR